MTEQQKKFILQNYGVTQTNSIAASLNISTATVIRWARRMGLEIKPAKRQFNPTKSQVAFILDNYGEMPCRLIAEELDIPVSAVRTVASRLGLKLTKEQAERIRSSYSSRCLNPNPVTYTTHMLICRYFYEGSSLSNIAFILGRSKDEVNRILSECMENGNYIKYNLLGR